MSRSREARDIECHIDAFTWLPRTPHDALRTVLLSIAAAQQLGCDIAPRREIPRTQENRELQKCSFLTRALCV